MSCMKLSVCVLSLLTFASSATADQFTDAMVSTKKVDFGVIATGTDVPKMIKIKNVHAQTYVIQEVKTSCSCAQAKIDKQVLQPGETAILTVKMNTRNFKQRKDSNVIVVFNSPRYTEVRIPVTAYIRTDMVFTPGSVQFGNVDLGTDGKAVVDIAYAGRSDWDIEDIKITNPNLKATLEATQSGLGAINYLLTIMMSKQAPVGRVRDLITIVTNDRANPNVPLLVDGQVVPDIAVSPPIVNLETVAAGAISMRSIVLKGKKPFSVTDVDLKDMKDSVTASIQKAVRPVQVLPVKFKAPMTAGRFKDELLIKIADRKDPIRVTVIGTVAQ